MRSIVRAGLGILIDSIQNRRLPSAETKLIPPKLLVRRSSLRKSLLVKSSGDSTLKQDILEYLKAHYASPGLSSLLATRFGFSKMYFLKKFKSLFGKNFAGFLVSLRLEHAAQALRRGGRSITRIYLENGFGSHAHFNKLFKKRFGVGARTWLKRT